MFEDARRALLLRTTSVLPTKERPRRTGPLGGETCAWRTERSDRRALGNDPGGAICVRRLDDSLNSAIRTRYRSLLRSSSMHEPRDPPLEVVTLSSIRSQANLSKTPHEAIRERNEILRRHGSPGKTEDVERLGARGRKADPPHWASPPATGTARLAPRTPKRPPPPKPNGRSEWTGDRWSTRRTGKGPDGRDRKTLMILPQVHLRKPCYDFYFL